MKDASGSDGEALQAPDGEALQALLANLAIQVVEGIEQVGVSSDEIANMLEMIGDVLAAQGVERRRFATTLHESMERLGSPGGLDATTRLLVETGDEFLH